FVKMRLEDFYHELAKCQCDGGLYFCGIFCSKSSKSVEYYNPSNIDRIEVPLIILQFSVYNNTLPTLFLLRSFVFGW
ncbi:MAG: hypothetical protein ACQES9_13325, partial [Myxococcota bacterium]